ncbi:hypothetical protein RvY_01250-2 [Ramazzottius varieornatus]|uniref:LRAT domain-containing protein n=1 Tax=Ramazzottius varieornatus TaxID=947166 RepID=A0A1D1UJ71_RAMVA|nr:hypothetical protein RvY_01250-2 [Ramazzottius varieornatus]
MGNASSAAAKKASTEAAEMTSALNDPEVETVSEPGSGDSTKQENSPDSQQQVAHVTLSSPPEHSSASTTAEKKDSDLLDISVDELKVDSSVSHEVAEQLTAVTQPGNASESSADGEIANEGQTEPSSIPENSPQQFAQGNDPILPTDPDLTHWVHIDDWEERKHWFHQGDLVEFYRGNGLYNHWGVYMGNGCVAHVTTFNLMTSSTSVLKAINIAGMFFPSVTKHPLATAITVGTSMCIQLGEMMIAPSPPDPANNDLYYYRMDPIVIVAGTDQFRVNNLAKRAKDHVARTWEETFKLVHERINTVHKYSLLRNNCEHIATFFRYKPKESGKKPRTE